MIDPLKVLYVYLTGNSEITSNSIAVYGPPGLPVDWSPSKTIVFSGSGGLSNLNLPVFNDYIEFRCYGASAMEAREVHTVLYSVLHREGLRDVDMGSYTARITHTQEAIRPYDLIEPVTEYFYVMVRYWVKMVEVAV